MARLERFMKMEVCFIEIVSMSVFWDLLMFPFFFLKSRQVHCTSDALVFGITFVQAKEMVNVISSSNETWWKALLWEYLV